MRSQRRWQTMLTRWRCTSFITTSSAFITTLRVTPAMAAGVTDREMSDMVGVLEHGKHPSRKHGGPIMRVIWAATLWPALTHPLLAQDVGSGNTYNRGCESVVNGKIPHDFS